MKTKSICGNYTAVFESHQSRSHVIDRRTGIVYNGEVLEKDGSFYAPKHGMTSYHAYGKGMEKPSKYFTLCFADFREGEKIDPWTGNTIVQEYTAIFRVPPKRRHQRREKQSQTKNYVPEVQ